MGAGTSSRRGSGEVDPISNTSIAAHEVCGYTESGVPAFSNGHSNRFANEKHMMDGLFMGYKWQCVEFARRWLWQSKGLLLPERRTAYGFEDIKYVRRPVRRLDGPDNSSGSDKTTSTAEVDYSTVDFEKVPCRYVSKGAAQPPKAGSLIIYPLSWGSPWGHIGVITDVDEAEGVVCVADQNRYFHSWGENTYSAAFPLDCVKGKYYIRDPENECKGWVEFDDE